MPSSSAWGPDDPPSHPDPSGSLATSGRGTAGDLGGVLVQEASWVRSVYLYLMCLVSIVLIGLGAIGAVTGAVHAIAPDLGHRDTLDRVGIGLSNVAVDVVDLLEETEGGSAEDFCRDVTDNADDFDDCVDAESSSSEMGSITDGIAEVRNELESQIRNNSIDQLIRGLLLIGAGVLLFRIHGHRTELFADGVMPKRAQVTPIDPLAPAPAPAPTSDVPAPPVPPWQP